MTTSVPLWLFLVALATSDPAPSPVAWWSSDLVYQIYPRSFADSDGDGNGDIRGIVDHVPYLADLGVGVVWLSPIYASPWEDMGYDIGNFTEVHPVLGTLDDLKDLLAALHQRGMRLLLDLVPNHTSDKHPWFVRAREGGQPDLYVWRQPGGWNGSSPLPPNNWRSEFGGSAWDYVPERGQFYLHQFGKYQPDLDYSNPAVLEAIKEVMRFWLELGVDGFRVDAVPFLVEDPELRDEPRSAGCAEDDTRRSCLSHIYTENQEGTFQVLQQLDHMVQTDFSDRYLFLEAYAPDDKLVRYQGALSSPFNFALIQKVDRDTDARRLKEVVDTYVGLVPRGRPYNWVTGNHDNSRVGSRLGEEMVDPANALVLLLPGVAVTYQGEELGMLDLHVRPHQKVDFFRDPERTPFHWDQDRNAGFTAGNQSWLPVNPNHWRLNVESENKSNSSHLSTYRALVAVRKELAGSTALATAALSQWVFAFSRSLPSGQHSYYILLNLNNLEEEVELSQGFTGLPAVLTVAVSSGNSGLQPGLEVSTEERLALRPMSVIVLKG